MVPAKLMIRPLPAMIMKTYHEDVSESTSGMRSKYYKVGLRIGRGEGSQRGHARCGRIGHAHQKSAEWPRGSCRGTTPTGNNRSSPRPIIRSSSASSSSPPFHFNVKHQMQVRHSKTVPNNEDKELTWYQKLRALPTVRHELRRAAL